jgi:phosphate transport system substrate-binding protein
LLLAGDALVLIVNVNNNVKKLTKEQIKAIFAGEISNWLAVGGHDGLIQTYSRDEKSGTYNFFKESVLKDKRLTSKAKYLKDNQSVISAVANDPNGIGITSFTNLDYSVNPLDVSFDEGKTFVSPRLETVNNLKYKYYRGLFLYYKPEFYTKIKVFLDTVKSDSVQSIIKANGYIPLSTKFISKH